MNSFISSMQQDFNESFSTITVFQLAASPSDAVSRCVGLWKMKGAHCASIGMREQFKQRGWSGTELVIGHSGRAFLTNVFFETRSYRRLLSHAPLSCPTESSELPSPRCTWISSRAQSRANRGR